LLHDWLPTSEEAISKTRFAFTSKNLLLNTILQINKNEENISSGTRPIRGSLYDCGEMWLELAHK